MEMKTMKHGEITEAALAELVDAFYARVREDPRIGPLFNEAIDDWPEHLDKLQAFWSSVMLTSGRYKGRPLPAHIKHGDRIGSPEFARWLALWKETTERLFHPEIAGLFQEKAGRIAESLSLGIQFNRGGDAMLQRSPRCPAAEVRAV